MTSRGTDRGFTLVELLVALSLASFVIATLASVFGFARKVADTTGGNARDLDQIVLFDRVLSGALANVISSNQEPYGIRGSSDSLSIVTVPPRPLLSSSVANLTVRPDSDGNGLMALWRFEGNLERGVEHRLIDPIWRLRFKYLGHDGAWHDEWTDPGQEPILVRMLLERADYGRLTMRFELPVRSVAHAGCAIKPRPRVCGGP